MAEMQISELVPALCSCGKKISIQQALQVLRGGGFVKTFRVRSKQSGTEFYLDERSINPETMEVLGEYGFVVPLHPCSESKRNLDEKSGANNG